MAKNNSGMDLNNIKEILSKTRVIPVNITEQMRTCFISYAMAVNVSRAIPDVRDGLKPVQRRILFAMNDMGNTYDKPTKKCARIVGEVMGKYHPHGDSSVYDALVRLAQGFSINVPLVDGQGNFGTVDGDPPAAQRYTEARLSKIAGEMLRDIDKETVNFYPNFDDTLEQPEVLPSRFPNLLVNGSEGIAVGMATSIPPHNLNEVVQATIALMDNPDITIEELMGIIPCPDYPTGGLIMARDAIRQAYLTGHGGIVIRAKTEIEENNGRERIIVTEIPYQVNKALLIKDMADQVRDKKLEGISDIRDESDRFGMRVVIEIKRDANAQVVLNTLYKQTNLQISTGINFLALVKGTPVVLNLKQMLQEYLNHQIDVIERRTRYNLRKAQEREHIVEGLVIALANIDEVIKVIKESRERADAIASLTEKFLLTEKQANAILEMKLSRLTGLEVEKLNAELAELKITIADLQDILEKPERVHAIIRQELTEIDSAYGVPRRSELSYDEGDIDIEDLIVKEDVVISMTNQGYVKRISASEYKAQNRGGFGVTAHKTKEEDWVKRMFVCNSHDNLLFFSNKGKAYALKAYRIPEGNKTGKGRAIVNVLPLENDEKITAFLSVPGFEDGYIIMATKQGLIKKTEIKEFESVRSNGKKAITLTDGDELIGVEISSGENDIIIASHNGKCIRFAEKDVRRTGRDSQGVRSLKLSDDDYIVDMAIVDETKKVVTISELGFGKRTSTDEFRCQGRAGKGIKAGNFNEKTGLLVNMKLVGEDEDLILIADNGIMIRILASQISEIGRSTKGVTIMKLREGAKVVAMAQLMHDEEAEFDKVEVDENALKEAQAEASQASDEPAEEGEQTPDEQQ